MSSRKNATKNLYIVHDESGISSTRTTCKKTKLDEILAAHCRADLVTECMKRKKTLIITGDFRFRFSAENGISFSSAVSFTAENEKYFSVGL